MMQTVSILVTGRVQGVFYRQSAKEKAIELGLTGTVENLPDGNVYIRASGAREQLDLFINWCWKGPSQAKVASVEVTNSPYQKFEIFRIVK